MQDVSAGFLAAWRSGGRRVRRVSLSTSGGPWAEVPFTDYKVDAARGERAVSRYSTTVTLPPGVDPALVDEFATRVQVRAGFVVAGVEELLTLATTTVYDVEQDNDTGRLDLTGFSVERAVEDAQFRSPFVLPPFSGIAALQALLAPARVPVQVRTHRNYTIPSAVYDSDRWGAVQDLATAMSVDVHADPYGWLVIDDVPTLADPLAFTLDGVTVSSAEKRTRQGVPSVVVVEGSRADQGDPPRGVWVDDNRFSPTYIGGPFGEVVRRVGNPLMLTAAQCTLAASTIGRARQGLSRSLTMATLTADFLEPGDVVEVVTRAGARERHIVDSMSHSSSGTQSLTTRTTGG